MTEKDSNQKPKNNLRDKDQSSHFQSQNKSLRKLLDELKREEKTINRKIRK